MSVATTTIMVPDAILQVYQHMLPDNPDGIAFLFSSRFSEALQVPAERAAIEYQITREDAIEELRRLLVIKTFTVDKDANKISPTPLMDGLWHAAILDTQLYADLQDVLGVTLHHRPSGASEQESRQREKRLIAMKVLYSAFFSTDPLESAPQVLQRTCPQLASSVQNPISIIVMTLTGKTITMTVSKQATIFDVKTAIQHKEGPLPNVQNLIFKGKMCEDVKTVEDYNIGDQSIVYLTLTASGC